MIILIIIFIINYLEKNSELTDIPETVKCDLDFAVFQRKIANTSAYFSVSLCKTMFFN